MGWGVKQAVLVVFDVDDFKQINDSYGHVQGRSLSWLEIAECIKKAYANFGYCYRIGGDEFCVLLKNAGNEGLVQTGIFTSAGRKTKKDYIFTNGFLWISFVLMWGHCCC